MRSQFYFDTERENDPYALPDAQVWQDKITTVLCRCGDYDVPFDSAHATGDPYPCPSCGRGETELEDTDREGWFWWACFPGCLPDSDPVGPFATEDEAIANAREE